RPEEDLILCAGDLLVIAAGSYRDSEQMNLREVKVEERNEWVGKQVRELPLLSDEQVVMIVRNGRTIIPDASATIRAGDAVMLYNH
ncbi:MAG: K+/H+ antiporter, partial [Lachnospiraceae bacterium]|nr:K+/H+ antiporter [Lachnospiraceae bacterium]